MQELFAAGKLRLFEKQRDDRMTDEAIKQRWQEEKAGRILESRDLGLMQMIGLLQGTGTHAEETAAEESSGQRVYAAACRGLEEK